MKQTAVEWLESKLSEFETIYNSLPTRLYEYFQQSKEIEEKNLLEMLHKFGFDYAYNYRGDKTIYEWIPEWFEEYKRVNNLER